MTYFYPLQNLSSDIPKQLESFFAHLGTLPRRIISDFDLKLIGGKAREYLNSLRIHVNAAPSHRQDKNGLAERHWQTMVCMARNWLASVELPSTFWYYAVCRAAEVYNYFPFQLEDGSTTTPFELAHKTKPDLRVLFKPFTLAAVRRERLGDDILPKFESQSVPMITLGRCPNLMVYNFTTPLLVVLFHRLIIPSNIMYQVGQGLAFGINRGPSFTDWTNLISCFLQSFLWNHLF
jgi:hypothetical protein